MSSLLYKTHRTPEMFKRILFRLVTTIVLLVLWIFMIEPVGSLFKAGVFINILTVFFISRIFILLIMLRTTRHPFVIYSDYVVLCYLWSLKRPFAHIIGREKHDKTGQVCLLIKHPKVEKPYQEKIPFKYIVESEEEVATKIDELILSKSED